MKDNVYTVEWIEDKTTEVSIVYDDYHKAYTMFQELKEQDTVEELVFSIRNKEKTQENPRKTTGYIKKKGRNKVEYQEEHEGKPKKYTGIPKENNISNTFKLKR